jgi:hypothetical protein
VNKGGNIAKLRSNLRNEVFIISAFWLESFMVVVLKIGGKIRDTRYRHKKGRNNF